MKSQPNTSLRSTQDTGTRIYCACGAIVTTLKPGEGVYPRGVLMRTVGKTTERKATCHECGVSLTIPVTTL